MINREALKDRAALLRAARAFFDARGLTEVDVPLLSQRASVDAHIDLIPALYGGSVPCWLHSSPEYGMKRLLAEGSGDIYQLSHVFRDGELGRKHNPEFMMAEWYRIGFTFDQLIDETLDFIRLFLGPLPAVTQTYQQVFLSYCNVDPLKATFEELLAVLKRHQIPLYKGLEEEGPGEDGLQETGRQSCLNLLLATLIEPHLGKESLFVLSHYPATQAALAKTLPDGTAERFEVYYKGVELCNGYHELADAVEQEARLKAACEERKKLDRPPLPIDTLFLEALKKGLPPCCGVAVGFDRLMMLRQGASELSSVIPFDFNKA